MYRENNRITFRAFIAGLIVGELLIVIAALILTVMLDIRIPIDLNR